MQNGVSEMWDERSIRRNVYECPKKNPVVHNGVGRILFCRPFAADDFETAINFVDYVEIPPDASIGIHTHGANEEVYFIVEGSGLMTVNQQEFIVTKGDLVVNRIGWSHGLKNSSNSPLKVLVWEVDYSMP